ncbi:thiamine-phosphate kinase [Methylomonas sp. SURF-1]|uniref:Thiamine-monophosphate kinase n=1 Tax=Methylomonas aurea TaxID=2952224 RepID=A0ABT1UJJ0_9GAMM|nr:thiamine-phosphate kinase [Methylomonas sp. SURF-1]MCQ8182365.1 thiamine-phosphate kinase [Methylomonas sp. SURF-1]
MALGEFDLIRRFFAGSALQHPFNQLGIGDDCALLNLPDSYQIAVTADTMVENVHFFADVDPNALGHKVLAVNLSDLAAMGAEPFAVTLALTVPKVDEFWLQAFADGFLALARQYRVDLVGGDTTSGPLTLTVQAMGAVPRGQALLRSGARPGDLVFVSGPIGDAGLGLKIRKGLPGLNNELALQRMDRPLPRIETGLALRGIASACIDISDGLAADLGHILQQSDVGAVLDWDKLPLSAAVSDYIATSSDWTLPLSAGDDYELCFTVPAAAAAKVPAGCHCVGVIEAEPGLRMRRAGRIENIQARGYQHFA